MKKSRATSRPTEEQQLPPARAYVRVPRGAMPVDDPIADLNVLWDDNANPDEVIDMFRIDSRIASYQKTGNPVQMIEAFLLAQLAGVYPPKEALSWLADCFRKYHEDQGISSMDACMGLGQKGRTPPFKALLIEERNEMLFQDMTALMCLGATREEAADVVAPALASLDWNHTSYEIQDPSAQTMIDLHARWKAPGVRERLIEHLSNPGRAAAFLQKFDRKSLPKKLLRFLD